MERLASKIEVERVAGEQDRISCHSGSNIQFTSGTTGKPKATLLSHRSLFNNSKQVHTCIHVYMYIFDRHLMHMMMFVTFVVERIKDGDKDGAEGVLERSVLPRVRPD